MTREPQRYTVRIQDWILDRKSWYYYLIPPDPWGRLSKYVDVAIDKEFFEIASRYMNAFLEKGEMPPEQIAPAIFNMLDDYAAGRNVVIRSGDYIAMQNFMRAAKK